MNLIFRLENLNLRLFYKYETDWGIFDYAGKIRSKIRACLIDLI